MTLRVPSLLLVALAAGASALADDPPSIEYQPFPCTVAEKPIGLCASISDDSMVAKARLYFRPAHDKYYSFVEMTFSGLNYCGTVPAPREGKLKSLDYYIQATDDHYNSQRTSTFSMEVQAEGVCAFPPVEKNPERAATIKVYGTHPKQGHKLPDEFEAAGVTFVPAPGS
jgi:hypothetical protein